MNVATTFSERRLQVVQFLDVSAVSIFSFSASALTLGSPTGLDLT